MRFTRKNLRNIRCIFEEKTGMDLNPEHHSRKKTGMLPLVAAVITLCALCSGCAVMLFSSLEGDELALNGTYAGNGVVQVQVENRSDKTLRFQKQIKLMSWQDSREIPPVGEGLTMENTVFPAHSSGTMTIDLSEAYDVQALEEGKPLLYYLVLTNNNFVFGQDWMCSFRFRPEEEGVPAEIPGKSNQIDGKYPHLEEIPEQLQFYFERAYYDEIPALTKEHFTYQQKVQELLLRTPGTLVRPVSPAVFVEVPDDQIFDPAYPAEKQGGLVVQNYHALDGMHRMVGSAFGGLESDQSLMLQVLLPAFAGQVDGGAAALPVCYLFVYEKAQLAAEAPYAFLSGRILPFGEMEIHKVYEDERYCVYNMTHLFIEDLQAYVHRFLACYGVEIWYDENVFQRISNIYAYFQDPQQLGSLVRNHQQQVEQMAYQPPKG